MVTLLSVEKGRPRGAAARSLLLLGLWLVGGGAGPVRAQGEEQFAALPSAEPAAARSALLISAGRQGERAQQLPVSVSAISAIALRANHIRRLSGIESLVPNLVFDNGTALANTARVSLRGLSQSASSSAADPVVGIYVDGVYRARLQGNALALFDVERIEVLRGPQGTLFGKNTIGGALNVTTRAPDFELGGDVEVRIGNFDLLETRLSANVPLVPEKAAVRVSLATSTRDGFISNGTTGNDEFDEKLLGGRLQLLALPSSNVELGLTLEHSIENRRGFGAKCVLIGRGQGLPGAIANSPDVGFRQACAADAARSELKVAGDVSFVGDRLKTFAASNRLTWDLSPNVSLTSISAWRRQKVESFFDLDATKVSLIQFQNDSGGDTQSQFSQEFQLSGLSLGGQLRYAAGLFALKEENNEREFFGPGFVPRIDDSGEFRVVRSAAVNRNIVKADSLSLAGYGQLTYSFSDRLDLTVGARLTKDRRRVLTDMRVVSCSLPGAAGPEIELCRSVLGSSPSGFAGFERSGRFGDISPSASLSYAFAPKVLGYVSYATAFQSGGFDPGAATEADAEELENQEITSYEVGVKSTWFDDRLLLNANYFYQILSDGFRVPVPRLTPNGNIQFSQLDASALVRGSEIEIGALPLPALQLRASAGIQRAQIEDSDQLESIGLSNRRLPVAPNYTLRFEADYEQPLGRFGTLGLRSSWSHRGSQITAVQAPKQLDVSKYGLLDGRVSLELPDGRTQLALFGSNLLDRRYFNAGFSAQDTFGFGVRLFGPPRFYGIELRRTL
jgi:iron complex outermembrane receptor protein